jgi:ATP-dependent RNA helicase DDX35
LIQAGYTIGDKKIGIVLPRKIAAISIAKRVAEELGCHNGEVTYRVRFNSGVNSNTRVLFMTDGTLVQELYGSPLLDEYSVVILDDVHERSVSYDILFSFLKRILRLRPEFKVIITSATL